MPSRTLVYGAGAIGGYLGGTLLAAGLDVTLLGRESVGAAYRRDGLKLTDYQGRVTRLDGAQIPFLSSLEELEEIPKVVLLTVKCTAVEEAIKELSRLVTESTLVVCCQNGIGTDALVARSLKAKTVAAIVGFNVIWLDGPRLHRGTDGALLLQPHPALAPLLSAWQSMGLPVETRTDFTEVSWGKLLLNLNNAINALAGVPLLQELSDRDYRRVLSACMRELLAALKRTGIKPAKLTKVPPFLVPWLLRLPDWLFKLVAGQMLRIDPLARSSMADDLEKGRPTEIEFLNQAVVELARGCGLGAPANEQIVSLVREAERNKKGSPNMSSSAMLSRILGQISR
ncbi:MAG: 2-dehydropantoate 2-reductase [Vulcanimicrobiota bacterium]